MLIEIECDDFICHGLPRGKIYFHNGLNVIKGEINAKNSIGKTTSLQVIDFCFGGSKYCYNKEVLNNTQCSDIKFAFEFDGIRHYYRRNIKNKNVVKKCDSNYNVVSDISLNTFCIELKQLYEIKQDITFRDFAGRFSRLNNSDVSEWCPLHKVGSEKTEKAVTAFEKIFDIYDKIAECKKEYNELSKKKKAYLEANKSGILSVIKKKDYEANIKKISEKTDEIQKIVSIYNNYNINQELNSYIELSSLSVMEMSLKRKLRSLHFKKEMIVKGNITDNSKLDIDKINNFFPGVNLRKLEEVQNFHQCMKEILETEMQEELSELESEIYIVTDKLEKLCKKKQELNNENSIPLSVMKKYADLTLEIRRLEELNNIYEKSEQNKIDVKEALKRYTAIELDTLNDTADQINRKMKDINRYIHNQDVVPPIITFKTTTKGNISYSFESYNDSGKGKTYKNIIVYDLSIMELTSLPMMIHDTDMFKHIEFDSQERILDLYKNCNKQIFIAYDAIPDNNIELEK